MTAITSSTPTNARPIDPRGVRFTAGVTALVLALALVLRSPWLLALQALVFGMGVGLGPARQPHAVAFRRLVRPRLGPPSHLEHPAAPRFAQACGLAFALVGLLGFAVGATWLALAAISFALAAAFLNAAFDFCIGCEIYLRFQRVARS
jgi:hypothetical protein